MLLHLKRNQVYNLGSDKPQSIAKLAKLIGGKIISIPNRPGEPRVTWANTSKIRKDLKWKPLINFEDGVKIMLNNIEDWKLAPLWSPATIKTATKEWFKYLGK